MAFPNLYPTGPAAFEPARERKVDVNDYARHMVCYHDGKFGEGPPLEICGIQPPQAPKGWQFGPLQCF